MISPEHIHPLLMGLPNAVDPPNDLNKGGAVQRQLHHNDPVCVIVQVQARRSELRVDQQDLDAAVWVVEICNQPGSFFLGMGGSDRDDVETKIDQLGLDVPTLRSARY